MTDWQVGDLAVCVDADAFICSTGCLHTGEGCPSVRTVRRISRIALGRDQYGDACGCISLNFDDGTSGISTRFRKIVKADSDFIEQMRAIKPRTDA